MRNNRRSRLQAAALMLVLAGNAIMMACHRSPARSAALSGRALRGAFPAGPGPLMILDLTDILFNGFRGYHAQPPYAGIACPICGRATLLRSIRAQATLSFGHRWAIHVWPGDFPSFQSLKYAMTRLERYRVPFIMELAGPCYMPQHNLTRKWAAAKNCSPVGNRPYLPITHANEYLVCCSLTSPAQKPPFTPANVGYDLWFTPRQMQALVQAAPHMFWGMYIGETPRVRHSPAWHALLAWVAHQQRPLMVGTGSTHWLRSWLPFIRHHSGIAIPTVEDNEGPVLDRNWRVEEHLFRSHQARRIAWSVQNFAIDALTHHAFPPHLNPPSEYMLAFAYDWAYGGDRFELEADNAVFTRFGTLSPQGKAAAAFFHAVSGWRSLPVSRAIRDTYGMFVLNRQGQVQASSLRHNAGVQWRGDSQITWKTPVLPRSVNQTELVYRVRHMYAPQGTALMAVFNPGPRKFPALVKSGCSIPGIHWHG